MTTDTCRVCNHASTVSRSSRAVDELCIECPRCGRYVISGTLHASSATSLRLPNPKLSAWIRDYQESLRDPPELNTSNVGTIIDSLPSYSAMQKQLLLLRALERRSSHPGQILHINPIVDVPLVWGANDQELLFHLRTLVERELLWSIGGPSNAHSGCWITAKGWEFLEQHQASGFRDRAFVAMSFAKDLLPLWTDGLAPAISGAGYAPYRVDSDPHVDRIDARIIAAIRDSRFLVADVTGQRQGVYYEAGFAHGLSLPVVWTVREDDLSNVHFDTRQYNHIPWREPADLVAKLKDVILAVIGRGPHAAAASL